MNLTQLIVTPENVDELSAKFGLSQEQTREAMASLIPAFSEGLKRQSGSPKGAASLIEALSTGRHAHYARDPSAATNKFGINDGNAILGHLFGNKKVSRAVAGHAAASTGIGGSILKSMLPAIASMVMGSLFKGAGGGGLGKALGGAAGGGLLGQIIEGVAGGMLGGARQSAPRRRPSSRRRRRSSGSLEDLLGQVLGNGYREPASRTPMPRSRTRPTTRRQRRQSPTEGGLDGILDDLLGGGQRTSRSRTRQNKYTPRQQPRRRSGRSGGLGEIFGDMLEPGGNTSPEYQRQTGSVFDEFLDS